MFNENWVFFSLALFLDKAKVIEPRLSLVSILRA